MLRRSAPLVALALVAAGCGSPPDLAVGMKQYATDLAIASDAAAAAPAADPGFPSPVPLPLESPLRAFDQAALASDVFARGPAPPPRPAPPLTQEQCPAADPLSTPRRQAVDAVVAPPVAATYQFRNLGAFSVAGPGGRSGTYPTLVTRTVSAVSSSGGLFTYDVAVAMGNTTTTTSFLAVPSSAVPGSDTPLPARGTTDQGRVGQAVPGQAGLFVQRVTTRYPNGSSDVFEPSPALLVLPFPATPSSAWEARATGRDGTVMSYKARVGVPTTEGIVDAKTRVDACGEMLDAWNVQVTEGRVMAPNKDLRFTGAWAVGTQYGGLILSDAMLYEGTIAGAVTTTTNTATINNEPQVGS